MTLETGVMILKNKLTIPGVYYNLIYIKIEKSYKIVKKKKSQFYCSFLCI